MATDVGLDVIVYDNTMTLENKTNLGATSPWPIIVDGIGATLLYNDSGVEFEWDLDSGGRNEPNSINTSTQSR